MVGLLVAHPRILVNIVDQVGCTALLWATRLDRKVIVKLLTSRSETHLTWPRLPFKLPVGSSFGSDERSRADRPNVGRADAAWGERPIPDKDEDGERGTVASGVLDSEQL